MGKDKKMRKIRTKLICVFRKNIVSIQFSAANC